MSGSVMSDVAHWISRYWRVLIVLGGVVFWAGRLDMKVESLDGRLVRLEEKVDQVIEILLAGDEAEQGSRIAQGSGPSGEVPDARENP